MIIVMVLAVYFGVGALVLAMLGVSAEADRIAADVLPRGAAASPGSSATPSGSPAALPPD